MLAYVGRIHNLKDLKDLVCVRHEPPGPKSHPFEDTLLAGSTATLCTGGLDVIRKEAWPFYRTIFGVCLCWQLEEAVGPEGLEVDQWGRALHCTTTRQRSRGCPVWGVRETHP